MFRKTVLISIFILLSSFVFSQPGKNSITINKSAISVADLLKEVTIQSGLYFSYNPNIIDLNQKISFQIKNASLNETMELLSKKIPVEYSIIEGQIVLNQRKEVQNTELIETKYYTLSGFINDMTTGESLIGACIALNDRSRGTFTNDFGYYSLNLPEGKYRLQFSYLGFLSELEDIEVDRDEKMDIALKSIPQKLPEIIIEMPVSVNLRNIQPGNIELRQSEINNMPEFGGSSDLIKGLQARPGVKTHSDGSAFYYVRGGEKDQNLIIIDDAPIYNPAHLFGFYSLIIPDFTKSVKLYNSDIPVNLGDRLSSVLDIRTRDGNLKKYELNGATSFIMNRISLEGPIVRDKSSFFTSLRLSNFRWLYKNYTPNLNLSFGDFSFKWNYKFNDRNRFFFTAINGRDLLANFDNALGSAGIQWNNFAMTLRWNHIFNPKLFSNTILYTGNYQYQLSYAKDIWHSGIGNLSLKSDFTWYNSASLTTRFGMELHGYFFNPGKILQGSLSSLFPVIKQDYSRHSVLYLNGNYRFDDKWLLNSGARLSVWSNLGPATYYKFDEVHNFSEEINTGTGVYHRYLRVDPRLSLSFDIDSTSVLKSSYGLYHQFINLISNSTSPFSSFEVWLPSSPNIRPQTAHQMSIGYIKSFQKSKLEISAEAFYKLMYNQIDYEPHPHTLLNSLIEGELRFGKMKSFGIELTAKKEYGKLNGWITYTFSRALRQTPEVNYGNEYPAFHDRPHNLSAMLNYSFSRRSQFSVYYTVYTGSAFSSPTGFFTFNDITVPVYSEKNNDRLPVYKRMDIAFKFILNKNPDNRLEHNLTFSVYNVLANKNIVDVNFNKTIDQNNAPVVKADLLAHQDLIASQYMLVRFFPSLTYEFKFR
ncbi:MAG: carboxypeptidase-like regulatory domain-containing protein [Saprospiraceae bacterium]|nr:carboxypeptidase-like regulatory domain-containing protein [Saprospiraceae bacterium]